MGPMEIIGASSPKHAEQMRVLCAFVGARKIEYTDLGNGENYILTKEGWLPLTLRVRGNKDQGGFLCVTCP